MTAVDPIQVVNLLAKFAGNDLTGTLSRIERSVRGLTAVGTRRFLLEATATIEVLMAAAEMKRLAGQINVIIHSLGILLCLPHILEVGEQVEKVSLGAGNTGREFDLETNRRVAEFKFIHWRGGPEAIRQNAIFKDFFLLAESESAKRKYLYVLGTEYPLKFLNGGRALKSVLSRNDTIRKAFYEHFGERFVKVRDYYELYRERVLIQDVSPWLPELASDEVADETGADAV